MCLREPDGGAFNAGGEALAVVWIALLKPSRLWTRERRTTTAAVDVAPVLTIAAAAAAELMCGRLRCRLVECLGGDGKVTTLLESVLL